MGVRSARFLSGQPQFITRGKSRGRFAVGIRYEREAQEWLSLRALELKLEHRPGPWLQFEDKSGKRWCQPDALLVDPATRECCICEIKYQHTSDAWWQLNYLYLPVLEVALRGYSFRMLEIVHWFDPLTPWPEPQVNVRDLAAFVTAGPRASIGTLIFNRRRERRFSQDRHSGSEGAGEAARPIWPAKGSE